MPLFLCAFEKEKKSFFGEEKKILSIYFAPFGKKSSPHTHMPTKKKSKSKTKVSARPKPFESWTFEYPGEWYCGDWYNGHLGCDPNDDILICGCTGCGDLWEKRLRAASAVVGGWY
jgi:hypothetical protein